MNDNTGLKVVNQTSSIITIDLLGQGQVGNDVPVQATRVGNKIIPTNIVSSDEGINPTRTYYYSAGAFPSEYTQVSPSLIYIQSGAVNRQVIYADNTTNSLLSGTDPITVQDFADAIVTDFNSENGTTDSIQIIPICEIKDNSPTPLLKLEWGIYYLQSTAGLNLIKQIKIN